MHLADIVVRAKSIKSVYRSEDREFEKFGSVLNLVWNLGELLWLTEMEGILTPFIHNSFALLLLSTTETLISFKGFAVTIWLVCRIGMTEQMPRAECEWNWS